MTAWKTLWAHLQRIKIGTINRLQPALFQPLFCLWIINVNRDRFVYFECTDHRCGVTRWITGSEFCQARGLLSRVSKLIENIVISLIRSITFNEDNAAWWKAYAVMKREWQWPATDSWKKEKGASQWREARLVLCASAPSNSNKGAFPTFKRPRFTFNNGCVVVAIKHMALRRCSFVEKKTLRW